jgi:hypothetical protein
MREYKGLMKVMIMKNAGSLNLQLVCPLSP